VCNKSNTTDVTCGPEAAYPYGTHDFILSFSGVCVARSFCVLLSFFIWPSCCLSFSFGHRVVCLFHLAIVLSLFFIWPLCCLSFSFGHCVVCLFHLVIVLSVFFIWPLCCLSRLLITPLVSWSFSHYKINLD
jgi:hypothetical protein